MSCFLLSLPLTAFSQAASGMRQCCLTLLVLVALSGLLVGPGACPDAWVGRGPGAASGEPGSIIPEKYTYRSSLPSGPVTVCCNRSRICSGSAPDLPRICSATIAPSSELLTCWRLDEAWARPSPIPAPSTSCSSSAAAAAAIAA